MKNGILHKKGGSFCTGDKISKAFVVSHKLSKKISKISCFVTNLSFLLGGVWWGHLYFRLDIILVKGLLKHTVNTYFSGMKEDPKYMFLHVFCKNFSVMSFTKFVSMTKNTPFFPILHVFAPLTNVRVYIAWSWKITLITWIFSRGWYLTSNTSGSSGMFDQSIGNFGWHTA